MINTFIGNIGHFFVIVAFVTALLSVFSYYKASTNNPLNKSWGNLGRWAFYAHFTAVAGIVFCLFNIIYAHRYEYQYAWSHSSTDLPVYYMISCFWEGQEGSFLLWLFWQALLGLILINTNKSWTAPVMTIYTLVQAFLASMILGVIIIDLKIGSSPFMLMRDAMPDLPIFKSNPDFIPQDGKGLNPLLQNYWMVIHPPTLFLGFAATLIPFSYCIAGIWKNRFKEWIRPALPWSLFAALILGIGILMGAYWAYETLNFGGYWNWDPVENAVYVPWLILIAGIHTMMIFKKSNKALKISMILVITSFILILYSTFLTRSGILGESSVHSFTDLGLSGQLLIYLLFFTVVSIILLAINWRSIPTDEGETSAYSREFWIFIGATTLCLSAFQVLIPTSIPVYNAIVEGLGGISKLAPPVNQEQFYSKFQIWFAIAIVILSGTGQFFWWKKMDKASLKKVIYTPLIITLIAGSFVLVISEIKNPIYILLISASIYSIVSNTAVFISIFKNSPKLTGGAISHIGIALIVIGILFSSGYSNIISQNTSGLLYSKEFPDEINRDHILLWANRPLQMKEYQVTYKGQRVESKLGGHYLDKKMLLQADNPGQVKAKTDILFKGKIVFKAGEPIDIYPENTFYEIEYVKENKEKFNLYPRVQSNPQMGIIYSPDINRRITKDLYTHASLVIPPDKERDWTANEEFKLHLKDTFIINDYVASLDKVERVHNVPGIEINEDDVAIMAHIRILDQGQTEIMKPVYIIKDKMAGMLADENLEIGLKISLTSIDPNSGLFTLDIKTTQRDFIIMKAMEKPLINVLWIGCIIMIIGFIIAIQRRYNEFSKMRDKGIE